MINPDTLFGFIRREVPPPLLCELSEQTDLRRDLKMAEEDAEELLEKLFREFSISAGDFDFTRYFPEEGLWLLPSRKKSQKPAHPLTLGMLLEAIRDGVWRTAALEA